MTDVSIKIPHLFSSKGKNYHFTEEGIVITEDALKYAKKIIRKDSITAIRFGVKRIRGRYFSIGRYYKIELLLENESIENLKFSSYYGFKKKFYNEKFQELINAVWNQIFYKELIDIGKRFSNDETLYICGVEFNKEGLRWDEGNYIPWNKLKLKHFKHYFAIVNTDNSQINKMLYFLTDWNSYLLKRILEEIIKQRATYANQAFNINPN